MTGAGRFADYVTLRSATEAADSQGGAAVTWADVATVPAERVPLSSGERIQAQAVGSTVSYRFRLRSRTDVTPSMRVAWAPRWPPGQATQVLEVHGVTFEDDRATMLLECGVVQ